MTITVRAGRATFETYNTARCTDRGRSAGPSRLLVRVRADGSFTLHTITRNLRVSGSTERYSVEDTLRGRISGALARGTFLAVTVFRKGSGAYISTCSSGRLQWNARKT